MPWELEGWAAQQFLWEKGRGKKGGGGEKRRRLDYFFLKKKLKSMGELSECASQHPGMLIHPVTLASHKAATDENDSIMTNY